jgi:multiple sugar transport system permease protein
MKWFLIAPAFILLALFFLWPLATEIKYSLQKTDFISSEYVGLRNYQKAFQSEAFRRAWINSFFYMALLVVGQTGAAITIALIVCFLPKRWHDLTRLILYVPVLAAGIIISQVWRWIFHADGLLNWMIEGIFGERVRWFASATSGIPAIALVVIMSSIGGVVIIFLATILSIDRSQFEAARLEGAREWQIKLRVILPQLFPMIALTSLLAMISAAQIFETVYALAPYEHTATVTFNIYRDAFQFGRYGFASAQAILLMIVTIALSIGKKRLERKWQ